MTPLGIFVIVVLVIIAFGLLRSIRMIQEWRRAVVLRLGRFHEVKGPGLFLLVPFADQVTTVIDMRIQTSSITAEQALTRDTISVGVDAIVFWQVHDAKAAAIQIVDYAQAVERVAQTSLREMIGATELSRLLSDRQAADQQLREVIAAKTETWGVAVISVEIRDVAIPAALQDAMSRQAQAAREKQARVTLAEAEEAIAQRVAEAAAIYQQNPIALQLRQMNLLYEMNKDRGATILVPTEMASSLGLVAGLAAQAAAPAAQRRG